jgi:uncharacterized protein YqeY
MSATRQQLTEDMKTCMKSGEKARLTTIRGILAAIKQIEIDTRETPDEAQVLAVLNRLVKQRKDSLSQFDAAGRQDLAEVERFELDILQAYLPKGLSESEIDQHVADAVAETAATSPADMGKVMALLKSRIPAGLADMALVSIRVKARLAG